MMRILVLPTLFLSLMLVAPAASAEVHTVTINNLSFLPGTIVVNQGDTVEWTNIDGRFFGGIPHTTTSGTNCAYDGTGWDSGTLSLGGSFAATFNVPGEYRYFCSLHCQSANMTGTVIVNPVIMAPPSTAEFIDYTPVVSPVVSPDPFQSMPVGVGAFADGGSSITIRIQTASFQEPMDVYFGIEYAGVLSILTPQGFQAAEEAGLVPWMAGITDSLDANPFGSIPVSSIPPGPYTLYFAVSPATPPSGPLPIYVWGTVVSVF